MRKISVIGIGAGDPDQLTVQAVEALRRVDVFFLLDKGTEKADLAEARHALLRRHLGDGRSGGGRPYRLVTLDDPERDRAADGAGYPGTVTDWRARRADRIERAFLDELGEDATGAFLVWGDPSLYDSTLAVLDEVLERGAVRFDHEVIPGISSVSALAARHRTGLNRVGAPVQITTGRRLADEGWPEGVDDLVVMLDAHQSFLRHTADDPLIFWGAYVGTTDEILVSGRLSEVAGRIVELRAEARARKGWIMDTYLLRREP
ncbi:precorrin-6A synthase (deacetylating) [Streptomyces paludis]|uniref:Precorrin-6A synthase (Deacetylating) n=1 Tax=Streptomyces paludis TaxID=2282738 RepID=A0A345HXK9_9ACTN|nr:precorrin-6A synthase (deacetylating) [Streptomyces paludis]AXG81433.1 precorrin-6A synthase (deacetylating) [Streptomyces paludis]